MRRGLAIGAALFLFAHCGAFGAGDDSTPATDAGPRLGDSGPAKTEDASATADGAGGGGPDVDAATPPGPFCAERQTKPGFVACADFDHDDLVFTKLDITGSGSVLTSQPIGREPAALSVQGGSVLGSRAGGGRRISIQPLAKGKTVAIDFVLEILELADPALLDAHVRIGFVGPGIGNIGTVSLGFIAHQTDATHYAVYFNNMENESAPVLDLNHAYAMRFEVTRTDDTFLDATLIVDGNKQSLGSTVAAAGSGGWEVQMGALWDNAKNHGSVLIDDIVVTVQ